jgi:hypothetical protein
MTMATKRLAALAAILALMSTSAMAQRAMQCGDILFQQKPGGYKVAEQNMLPLTTTTIFETPDRRLAVLAVTGRREAPTDPKDFDPAKEAGVPDAPVSPVVVYTIDFENVKMNDYEPPLPSKPRGWSLNEFSPPH